MNRSRILFLVPVPLLAAIAILVGLYACGGGGGGSAPPPVTGSSVTFPLHVDASNRFLVDAAGKPFLLHGEAAWSLIAQASDTDVDQYLESRRQKGVNAIIVSLIEHKFADQAPNSISGVAPFTPAGDFTHPNDAYFAHADSVIQKAAAKGILVLLVPAYLGFNGGNEGWYQEMVTSGLGSMTAYGTYVGNRYKNYSNILWVNGGDYDPADHTLTDAIGTAIQGIVGSNGLQTAHCAPESSAFSCWSGASWLKVNNVYTYIDIPTQSQIAQGNGMPFFLIESNYENEHLPAGSAQGVRGQAYQALLSGAMGQVYGNNPIWEFSNAAGLTFAPTLTTLSQQDWHSWLDSPASVSMVHLRNLFTARSWWLLVPDTSNTLLTAGATIVGGTPFDLGVAAEASDRSFAFAYIPSSRSPVTVDLSKLSGPNVTVRWYNPEDGTFTAAPGTPYPATSQTIPMPPAHTSGFSDWVLVMESAS